MASKDNWTELAHRAFFHGGDSDSTGIIAGSLYGALYGYTGVFDKNMEELEYMSDLKGLAKDLYKLVINESPNV